MNVNNTIIFSTAIVIAVGIACITFLNRYPSIEKGYVEVKGMGQTNFESNLIVWEGTFKVEYKNLRDAYINLTNHRKIVESFLISNDLKDDEIVFGPVSTDEIFENIYSQKGDLVGEKFKTYKLSQKVMIESKDVAKIEKVSRLVTDVLNNGVQFYSKSPRYYYTDLSDLKLDLISKATEDARLRAENIVLKSGASLDKLVKADMGILQIVGQNSDENFSWGGSFNTSSKKKTASITIKLRYTINNKTK